MRAVLYGRVLLLCAVLIALSRVVQGGGQDALPFVVAARMMHDPAGWESVYLIPEARSLFDVGPAYQQSVADYVGSGVERHTLTAFVAPPPAVLLGWPWAGLAWSVARPLIVLSLLLPVLWAAARSGRASPGILGRGGVWLASVLVVFYAAEQGQLSILALPAAAGLLASERSARTVGAVALGLLCVAKASTLLLLPALWWADRRRDLVAVLSVVAFVGLAAMLLVGAGGWSFFFGSLRQIGAVTIIEKTNVAPDVLLALVVDGGDMGQWHTLSTPWRLIAVVLRLGTAAWVVWRARAAASAARVEAGWLAWLCLTPLHWVHYHVVLIPLLARHAARHPVRGVVLGAIASAPIALLLMGVHEERYVVMTGALGWLAVLAWWPPPEQED